MSSTLLYTLQNRRGHWWRFAMAFQRGYGKRAIRPSRQPQH
jgi:hypothetical protein